MICTLFFRKKPVGSSLYSVALNGDGRFNGFIVPPSSAIHRKQASSCSSSQFNEVENVKGIQMGSSNKLNGQQANMIIKALCDGVANGSISAVQIETTKEALVASVAAVNQSTSTLKLVSWRDLWNSV